MRRTRARNLVALPLAAALLLTGCSSNPRDAVRSGVEAVVGAANDRDPVAVRLAVGDLLDTLRAQTASGDLTPQQASAVANAARAVAQSAGLLEVAPSPSPVPPAPVTSAPSPAATQAPSPTPTPTPEKTADPPSPSPSPEQTTPPPPPIVVVSPAVVQTQSAAAPSPSPATAQQQTSPSPSSGPA